MMKIPRYSIFLLFISMALLAVSCKKEDSGINNLERYVTLDKSMARISIGGELVVHPQFAEGVTPGRSYQWVSDNPEIADVAANEDLSGKITAKKEGQTEIRFTSMDGAVYAICQVTVTNEPAVYKILAIGNHASEDALESYLYDLTKAENIPVIIGNLSIPDADLALHWQNASTNAAVYQYTKITLDGNKTSTSNTSIATVLADEDWNYISFQQSNALSGLYNTYTIPLPQLVDYVKQKASNPDTRYIFHQTWAYEEGSASPGFANYGGDQMTMYNAIVDAAVKVKDLVAVDLVVPSGTAIQNGRTSVLGEQFTADDGYHLSPELGRYTAACTWFEAVFGRSVLGVLFKPQALSSYEAEIAKQAAHFAVVTPGAVTDMVDYKGGFGLLRKPVYISFGADGTSPGWNGFEGETGVGAGASIVELKDQEGNNTRLSLTVTEPFNGRNNAGEQTTATDFNMPAGVSGNSYYGNAGAEWSGKVIKQSSFKITGLNKDKKYNFCFFGSRAGVGDNRETTYIVKGANESSASLNTSSNKTTTVCVDGIHPKENGEIIITVTAGPNNNNGNKFFYINAMRITAGD